MGLESGLEDVRRRGGGEAGRLGLGGCAASQLAPIAAVKDLGTLPNRHLECQSRCGHPSEAIQ